MACLGVRGVVELTACPLWRVDSAHVLHDLGLHIVREVACYDTALACREVLVLLVVVVLIDNKRTYYFVLHTCIGVESEAGMEWNTQTRLVRVSCTTTCEVVHPDTARSVVIYVVVLAIGIVVYAIWNTRILHPVACSFYVAWQTAGDCIGLVSKQLCAVNHNYITLWKVLRGRYVLEAIGLFVACYGTHTATELHRIGSDNLFAVSHSGYTDIVILLVAIESESTEIYPCAATHLLIDRESGLLTFVHNGILRLGGAVRQGLVAHIHGIVARRERWGVGDGATSLLIALHLGGIATIGEWVVALKQMGGRCSPTSALADSPLTTDSGFRVVHHLFHHLSVTLARLYYDGTCVLEHRHEERHGVGGGVEVLNGAPHFGTLPTPRLGRLVEILSVATPEGNMLAVQTLFSRVWARGVGYPLGSSG